MNKKILVTGGAGFIGHHFIDHVLKNTNWNVVCLDRLDSAGDLNRLAQIDSFKSERHRLSVFFHDLRAEINDEIGKSLLSGRGLFGPSPFDFVVHMAAGSHVDRSITDPVGFIMDNVVGTAHLFDLFRKNRNFLNSNGKLLYFSTDEVFGPAPEGVSFSEWDRMNPNNPYSAAKTGGEALCTAYSNTYNLPIMVTHCTNVFGERQHSEKFIPIVIKKVVCKETVQIHSDPTRTKPSSRFYVYVDNISSAVVFLLLKGGCLDGTDISGKYNISGEKEVTNLELAQSIAQILGKELSYEMIDYSPSRPKHDMRYSISDNKLRSLGWKPSYSFEEGLEKTIKWYTEK